jgi:hypothetical protein
MFILDMKVVRQQVVTGDNSGNLQERRDKKLKKMEMSGGGIMIEEGHVF